MNIHVGGGRSSGNGDLRFDKLLAFVIFFSWLSEVHAITVEWSLVSPYELSKSKSNWQTLQGAGDTANVDFSKGGQIAFVPAAGYGGYGGYGLFNRAYSPRQINLYMGNPKHGQDSSSEEHRHRKKHHEPEHYEPEHHEPEHHEPEHHEHHPQHHEHHPQHHKSAKDELNDEHAEQAEISAGIAGELSKLSQFMKAQVGKHIEMRDRELSQGNEEAARKEQIIIDLYQDQIKYLDGIEKAQEAIMAGEVEMYYDKDGAGHKPGHHGHHGGHGNHHGGGDKHHDADHPTHHHQYDDDNDGGGHGEDDEAEDEEHGDGHDDDEDEEHGDGHDDDEDEEHGDHGNHHEDEGHGHGEEDEFYDVGDKFEEGEQGDKHKLDKRSPFVSSFLPSLSGSDTAPPKTPDTATVDTSISPTPYSDTPADVKANAGVSPDISLSTTSTDVATPATPTVISPDENTNSGWFSWFGSNNTPVYSPYALLDFMSPADKSADNLMSLFNVFSDPSNSSYLSNASTLMRIVMFFMPGTGIVDQVYFTMALSKIMWEAASMYYEGYGNTEIAVVVLTELVEAAYLSRRDEDSIISQKILTPGNTVKIEGMDVPSFLKYVHNMKYPDLTESQEIKLQKDLDNLMNITYPNISPELKTTFTAGLKDTMRFLALFNVQGDLHVDNVDVNFSEVYTRMHSAFDDSPIEKIKKTILSAIDAVKSKFN